MTMAGVQQYVLQHGFTAIQAKGIAVMALYREVVTNASVMAFQDSFYVAGVICLVAVAPALLLRSTGVVQRRRGPVAME